MIGLRKLIAGRLVLRSGPALTPAPLAVLYGTASARAVFRVAEAFVPPGLGRLLGALDALDAAWPEYYHQLHRLDTELWPTAAPSSPGALLVLQPTGESAWFEYLPEQLLARRAKTQDVVIHDGQERPFKTLVEEIFPHLEHGRVGICLHRAAIAQPGGGPWLDAPDLVDSRPFEISEGGDVGVPTDFEAPPWMRDLLG